MLPLVKEDGDKLFAGSAIHTVSDSWQFQQDGAKPHTANVTKSTLNYLWPNRWEKSWPAKSPDLNCIENLWSWADQKLQACESPPKTIDELRDWLHELFNNVPIVMCRNLVGSLPTRLKKVVSGQGAIIQH